MKKIKISLNGNEYSANDTSAFTLTSKSGFGEKNEGRVVYLPEEVFYLFEKNKADVMQNQNTLKKEELRTRFMKKNKEFGQTYSVFKDLRDKGYWVKTAFKYGTEFRVYEKGKSLQETHAKWLVRIESDDKKITSKTFAANVRIANTAKKSLLLAVVDKEQKPTYYEINWVKP